MSVVEGNPTYDKMSDFIVSIFNVFQSANKTAEKKKDKRMKMIALLIFNYVRKLATDNSVDLKNIFEPETINLIPVFEYIAYKNIELFDFSNIDVNDVDTSKTEDLERFVLTHVYYLTQHI